jgi:hypothetical protein
MGLDQPGTWPSRLQIGEQAMAIKADHQREMSVLTLTGDMVYFARCDAAANATAVVRVARIPAVLTHGVVLYQA